MRETTPAMRGTRRPSNSCSLHSAIRLSLEYHFGDRGCPTRYPNSPGSRLAPMARSRPQGYLRRIASIFIDETPLPTMTLGLGGLLGWQVSPHHATFWSLWPILFLGVTVIGTVLQYRHASRSVLNNPENTTIVSVGKDVKKMALVT